MKVYKFYSEELFYSVAAKDLKLAKEYLFEGVGEIKIDSLEIIPESEWDEEIIEMYEDNDMLRNQFFISIRDSICGTEPQIVYTNDHDLTYD